MEATIMVYIGIIRYILGLYGNNGKENGSYYIMPARWALALGAIQPSIVAGTGCLRYARFRV